MPCRNHAEHVDGCHPCKLYQTDAGYRDLYDSVRLTRAVIAKPSGPCSHLGPATGGRVACPPCSAKNGGKRVELNLFACGIHGTCTTETQAPKTACCKGCKDFEAGDRITLNMGAAGLGDAMQGLLAVAAVKAANPGKEVVYRVSTRSIPFVRLFTGYDHVVTHDWDRQTSKTLAGPDRQLNAGFHAAEKPGGMSRIARYLKNAKASKPGTVALREPDRIRSLGADCAGAVALAPFSAYSDREYSRDNWLALEALLIDAGYTTVLLHNSRERTEGFRSRLIVGESAERVAGVLLNAAAVIGIDSGLTHIVGLLGRPTLALMAQTDGPAVFGCYQTVRTLAGGMDCGGCYWKPAAGHSKAKCKPACPNINSIPPRRVAGEVADLIAGVPPLSAGPAADNWRIRELKAFAENTPPYPGGEGDGVVTAGEGDYWPGVVVMVRMLRSTGCTLPVECWYRPAAGEINPADVEGLDVTLREIREPIDGWTAKLHGLSRSRFARAIWIDADCYPTRDPSPLLGVLGEHAGLAMWDDRTQEAMQHLKWDRVWPGGEKGVRYSAGQFVIDRGSAWQELAVANWIAERSAYYWRHMLGDNDAWTVACTALGTNAGGLGEIEKLPQAKHLYRFVCPEAEFIHRSGPKLIPLGVPGESATLRILADVIDAGHNRVIVPQPPPLHLVPRSRRALVTVAVGDAARRCLAVTGPFMHAYAKRCGADFVVLDWPGHKAWPMSCKFAIGRTLDHYDRIAYVDADVLLRPGCVNLFELCEEDEFGAVDEFAFRAEGSPDIRPYTEFRRSMGLGKIDSLPWQANAGVMVVPQKYRDIIMPPLRSLPIGHCAEQDHTNAMLLDSGARIRLMDRRGNWQEFLDRGLRNAPPDAVLHFNGPNDPRQRWERIQAAAEKSPVEPLRSGEVLGPDWFTFADLHERLIEEMPNPGVFVEVGSWFGRSTVHLAQTVAASRKRIGIHAVDTWLGTPSAPGFYDEYAKQLGDPYTHWLTTMAAGGVIDRVTPHRMTSVEGARLFSDGGCDVVFIDADHSEAAVAADIRAWLPKVCPGGVICGHDHHMDGVRAAVNTAFGSRVEVWASSPEWPCWLVRV